MLPTCRTSKKPRLGSMFAGIGGFDLGFERAGFEVAWCVEWDKHAQSLLRKRFPNAVVYGDIREVDPSEVESVDVISGGFPCQDLSVAGRRAGLKGSRSGLFYEAMRVVRGVSPRLLLLENVPGLLSSNRGHDFASVLREVGEGWDCQEVAWRILDSQFFGVAQRRRRVFIAASRDLGCAEQVLALPESGCWNPREGRASRKGSRPVPPSGADRGGGDIVCIPSGQADGASSPSFNISPPMTCLHEAPIIVGAIDCDIPKQRAQNAAQGHFIVVPIQDGRDIEKSQNGLGVSQDGHPAYTIDGTGAQALAYSIREDASVGVFSATEVQTSTALQAYRPSVQSHHAQLFIAQKTFRKSKRAQTDSDDETWVDDGLANTLNGFDTGDSRTTHAVVSPPLTASNDPSRSPQSSEVTNQIAAVAQASCGMVVRRLMPEECELLQGFPVGWTNIGSVEKPTADTHRYKQLGNAVTVNVAQWLASRCANELHRGSPDA